MHLVKTGCSDIDAPLVRQPPGLLGAIRRYAHGQSHVLLILWDRTSRLTHPNMFYILNVERFGTAQRSEPHRVSANGSRDWRIEGMEMHVKSDIVFEAKGSS